MSTLNVVLHKKLSLKLEAQLVNIHNTVS